jgi:hypothetical protein
MPSDKTTSAVFFSLFRRMIEDDIAVLKSKTSNHEPVNKFFRSLLDHKEKIVELLPPENYSLDQVATPPNKNIKDNFVTYKMIHLDLEKDNVYALLSNIFYVEDAQMRFLQNNFQDGQPRAFKQLLDLLQRKYIKILTKIESMKRRHLVGSFAI